MKATRLLALCFLLGCYSTPKPDCGFRCGPAGECPEDYQCASDGVCHRVGSPASLVCAVDARPEPDAAIDAPGDAPLDADVTPPTVLSTTPADQATAVSRTTTITVVFSEAVQNVDTTSFTVSDGANVSGTVAAQSPTTYVFTPGSMLGPNATVTVSFGAAITDASGNALVPATVTFMTGT